MRLILLAVAIAAGTGAMASGCSREDEMEVVPLPPEARRSAEAPAAAAEARRIPTHGDLPGPHPAPGEPADLPPGHPPVSTRPAEPETDGHPDLPLKKTGIGSAAELRRALEAAREEARPHLDAGFRLAFTARPAARDYAGAERELRATIAADPGSAAAHRALAYAVFNQGFNVSGALPLYEKAIELDPNYGEAHYALAFILGPENPARGRVHFEKAMSLGVPDERNLRERFYPPQR